MIRLTAHKDMITDSDGTTIGGYDKEFNCPFNVGYDSGLSNRCFVIYLGLFSRKYKIRECIVMSIKFNGCWLLRMDNGWEYFKEDIGKEVFPHEDLHKAIEICEEKNRLATVKIKYLR